MFSICINCKLLKMWGPGFEQTPLDKTSVIQCPPCLFVQYCTAKCCQDSGFG
jgi:hypothetical protein